MFSFHLFICLYGFCLFICIIIYIVFIYLFLYFWIPVMRLLLCFWNNVMENIIFRILWSSGSKSPQNSRNFSYTLFPNHQNMWSNHVSNGFRPLNHQSFWTLKMVLTFFQTDTYSHWENQAFMKSLKSSVYSSVKLYIW